MKKSMYVFGSLEIMLGAFILCVSSAIREFIPVWAYIEFQKLSWGSYTPDDYCVQLSIVTFICACLIVIGIVQVIYALLSKSEK